MQKNKKNNDTKQTSQSTASPQNEDPNDSPGLNYAVRGILVGAAIGVFAVLFGAYDSMPKAFVLGTIGGFFAGLTMAKIRKKQKLNKKP